jgi:hypothetical protein
VPEIIDPVFAKTSQNARFLLSENERFGLVFVKTGSINSGTGEFKNWPFPLYRPRTGHACPHKPNPSRETVPSILYHSPSGTVISCTRYFDESCINLQISLKGIMSQV